MYGCLEHPDITCALRTGYPCGVHHNEKEYEKVFIEPDYDDVEYYDDEIDE